MKKYILFLAGLMISLSAMSEDPVYKEHKWQDDSKLVSTCDRFSCEANFFIKTTTVHLYYKSAFFELVDGSWVEIPHDAINGVGVKPTDPGEHIYVAVVGEKNTVINAPDAVHAPAANLAPELQGAASLTINNMPRTDFTKVYQYDVYYCLAKPYVNRTSYYLYLDVFNNRVDTVLKSTAGGDLRGTQYCQIANAPFCEIWKGNSKIVSHSSKSDVLPYPVSFTQEGTYEYEVRTCVRNQSASEYERYTWIDHYTIYVSTDCNENLVYRKWDDVMFVNNGENGSWGFISYQWYCDGEAIDGANAQWIRTKEKPSRENWWVRVEDKDGYVLYSCPKMFNELPASAVANPHSSPKAPEVRKQLANGNLVIEYEGKTYNSMGIQIK